jgi:hypothetical protein
MSGSVPDRDPLGRPALEAEAGVALPGFEDLQLAATVDVIEYRDGVRSEALGERRKRRIAAEFDLGRERRRPVDQQQVDP